MDNAERELKSITVAISLSAPIEQVERAEHDLNNLEASIPVSLVYLISPITDYVLFAT